MRLWRFLLPLLISLPCLAATNASTETFQHLSNFIQTPLNAYILMLIAAYGLFFELANPGGIVPGMIGIIALLLALYAFHLLPINYTGLTLILIGMGLMLSEVYLSSFGIIGSGGIIAFVLGSVMLFDSPDPHYQLTWSIIAMMAVISSLFFFVIFTIAIRSQKKAIITGKEGLIGSQGTVLNIMNQQITVKINGELWDAISHQPLERGERVKVTHLHGLQLTVVPVKKRGE